MPKDVAHDNATSRDLNISDYGVCFLRGRFSGNNAFDGAEYTLKSETSDVSITGFQSMTGALSWLSDNGFSIVSNTYVSSEGDIGDFYFIVCVLNRS